MVGGNKVKSIKEFTHVTFPWVRLFIPYLGAVKRKLAYFPDKEDKTRVIAIGDYLSQSVLKPLHHYLFQAMKKIHQDCTFDQGSFSDKISG
jgi:hypothetical protein